MNQQSLKSIVWGAIVAGIGFNASLHAQSVKTDYDHGAKFGQYTFSFVCTADSGTRFLKT